jgi:hypothetical protein
MTYCKVFDTAVLTRLVIYQGQFRVTKRAPVSSVPLWSSDGTSGSINLYNNAAGKLSVTSFTDASERSISGWLNVSSNATADTMYQFHWAASAEI